MEELAVEVLNAPFMTIIGGAHRQLGQPAFACQIMLRERFLQTQARDADLAILILGEAQDAIETDWQDVVVNFLRRWLRVNPGTKGRQIEARHAFLGLGAPARTKTGLPPGSPGSAAVASGVCPQP